MAVVYALLGDTAESKKLIDQLRADHPSDFYFKFHSIPAVQALNLLHQNKAAEAIAILEPSRQYEPGTPLNLNTHLVVYVRGLAYLQMRDGLKATAGFQKILAHPGLNPVSVYLAMARINLARAYAMQGDAGKARTACQDFFALWKDADPHVPLLKEAEGEYAKLQ